MITRAILFIALATFLCAGTVRADDVSILPSRQSAVVLPLLKQFSPKDGYARIAKILGKEDVDTGNAIKDCFYQLDDGTSIRVRALGNKVLSIWHEQSGLNGIQVIYALDKTWEH